MSDESIHKTSNCFIHFFGIFPNNSKTSIIKITKSFVPLELI